MYVALKRAVLILDRELVIILVHMAQPPGDGSSDRKAVQTKPGFGGVVDSVLAQVIAQVDQHTSVMLVSLNVVSLLCLFV
jgi:hypothetical protein